MRVVWHRRDLRVDDNRALDSVEPDEKVLPVFVFDPDILGHASPPRVSFMLDCLRELREEYRIRGSDLVVLDGEPREVLVEFAAENDVDAVLWNRDYTGAARERDAEVRERLDDAGVEHESYKDAVLHEPDEIFTNDGDPYSVYTYYHRKWKDREKQKPYTYDLSLAEPPEGAETSVPSLDDLGFDEPEADVPRGGTEEARSLLRDFCGLGGEGGDIYAYSEDRDYPARGCTSRLSPHLKFGTVGIREVYDATERAEEGASDEDERESVEEFQAQLAWREFYTQVVYHNPNVVAENYKEYENPIRWRDDPEELEAWKRGETGYPIVDAGMRQLRNEAYMHNRIRMVVASFLTKDLMIDWREGYDWFRRKLVDHDTANDNGGWQWAASTGTDAQPYFRVFNPMTQGERYDPEAEYIKEYVPELSDVAPSDIHSWNEIGDEERKGLSPEYPAPIVDHPERREMALEMFEEARGETESG
ncbi:MAG: deoxyribodipyrimidine photo-lyase [Halobacteria archaeon]|nr:deoxyribodipyrimidine photo-lyase [Halobacteria archaeon]